MFKFLRRFLKEPEADEQVRLQEKFAHFRRLLDNNNQALETMADMEEKLSGDYVFDSSYISSQVHNLGEQVSGMVTALNLLTNNRYQTDLVPICQRLQEEMLAELEAVPTIPDTPFILPLSALNRELAPAVGGKMANLGEIGNRVGLPVPQGFAITAAAYKRFLESSSLAADLEASSPRPTSKTWTASRPSAGNSRPWCARPPCPRTWKKPSSRRAGTLPTPWLAVRSSAVGEDTEFSFAGQFATLLNVDAASLPGHYKEIVASKFTSRAIFYWKYQQFSVNALPMAVGVLAMVPARASGVMFSLDPHAPQDDTVLISAVWGLGQYAVDGTVSPDLFTGEPAGPLPHHPAAGGRKTRGPHLRRGRGSGGDHPAAGAGPGPLPHRRPGPDPGGHRPGVGGPFRPAPGYRVDRGGGGQPHHPAIPAPPDQRPGLCRRGAAARPGAHGGAHPPLRHPGGGGRGRRPGPPLPPR